VARLLHLGPYADEEPSLAALYAFIAEHELVPAAPHSQIYLTDPSSTPPSRAGDRSAGTDGVTRHAELTQR
jgi:hypothetical protein